MIHTYTISTKSGLRRALDCWDGEVILDNKSGEKQRVARGWATLLHKLDLTPDVFHQIEVKGMKTHPVKPGSQMGQLQTGITSPTPSSLYPLRVE